MSYGKGTKSKPKVETKKVDDTPTPIADAFEAKLYKEAVKLVRKGKHGRPTIQDQKEAKKITSLLLASEKYKEGKKKKIISLMNKEEAFKQVSKSNYFIKYCSKYKLTPTEVIKRMVVYIASYVNFGTVEVADSMVSMASSTRRDWMEECPAFAEAVLESRDVIADELESVALERAKAKSDTLLMFLLKAYRPEKFRDRVDSNVYQHGGGVTLTFNDGMLSPEEKALHIEPSTGVVN